MVSFVTVHNLAEFFVKALQSTRTEAIPAWLALCAIEEPAATTPIAAETEMKLRRNFDTLVSNTEDALRRQAESERGRQSRPKFFRGRAATPTD